MSFPDATFAAWCPETAAVGEWIEVTFPQPVLFTNIKIQKPAGTSTTWPTVIDIEVEKTEGIPGVLESFKVSLNYVTVNNNTVEELFFIAYKFSWFL